MFKDKTGDLELVATESTHVCPYCGARNVLMIDDTNGTSVSHTDAAGDIQFHGCPHMAGTDLETAEVSSSVPYGIVHVMIFTENGEMPEDKEAGDAPVQDQP